MFQGLLCKHSLLAVVSWLTTCRTTEERKLIYDQVLRFCNKNWFRTRYSRLPELQFPSPPSIDSIITENDEQKRDFLTRFREIIRCIPPKMIEKYLKRLESKFIRPIRQRRYVPVRYDPEDNSEVIQQFSNPPRRRRKRKLVFDTPQNS